MAVRPLIKYGQQELSIIEKKISLCIQRWALDWIGPVNIQVNLSENIVIPIIEELSNFQVKAFNSNHISIELTEEEIKQLITLLFKTSHKQIQLQPKACKKLIENAVHALLMNITPKKPTNDYASGFENDPIHIGQPDSGWLFMNLSIDSINIKTWLSPWHIRGLHTRKKPQLKKLKSIQLSTPSILKQAIRFNSAEKKNNVNSTQHKKVNSNTPRGTKP